MCHCNQCGSDWEPNARSGGNPVQCPRCKRVDWREPRKGVKNDELRGAGIGAVGAVVGSGNGAGVPVLPKARGVQRGLLPSKRRTLLMTKGGCSERSGKVERKST